MPDRPLPDHALGTLFALATAVLWAASATCFEAAGRRVGSLVVNLLRLAVAVVLLVAILQFRARVDLDYAAHDHFVRWLVLSGLLGFFVCDLCLFRAYVLLGARRSTLVLSLAPVAAAVLDAFALRRPPTLPQGAGIATTLAGVVWVISETHADETPHTRRERRRGVALALVAAVTQALGAAAAKVGMRLPDGTQADPFEATLVRAFAGLCGFAVLVVLSRRVRATWTAARDPQAMALLTAGAVAGPVLGVTCFLASLQHVATGVTQTVTATIPVLLLPVAVLQTHERVTWRAVAGAVFAVIGVVVLCLA